MYKRQVLYIGDGFVDIPVMEKVGLSIAVNNADDAVKSQSDLITLKNGGEGVLKEVAKFILLKQNKYDNRVIFIYLSFDGIMPAKRRVLL